MPPDGREEMKGLRSKFLVGLCGLAVLSVSSGRPSGYPEEYPPGIYAELTTNKGLIVLDLQSQKTPMTVANFVGLAEGTIDNTAVQRGNPYFDGTQFHRVVPGHVIQAGMPAGTSLEGPGYAFPNEIDPELDHGRAGMLGMANSGPHTNGSQFYITLADRSYLDGDYTVFGRVLSGMEVVDSIVQGDEILSVKIVRVGEAAEKFRPTTESFTRLMEEARVKVAEAEAVKKAEEEDIIIKSWPQAIALENGLRYIVLRDGFGGCPGPGTKLKVAYTGKSLNGTVFRSTADEGMPDFLDAAEAFDYDVGMSRINPGLDDILLRMKVGEKRLVIVPSALGYGTSGFYAKEKKGRKRFHVSPNTALVYEIEILDIVLTKDSEN